MGYGRAARRSGGLGLCAVLLLAMAHRASPPMPADTYPAIRTAIAAPGNPHSILLVPQPGQGDVSVPGAGAPGRVPTGMAPVPDLGYVLVPGIFGSEQAVLEYARAGAAVVEGLDRGARCGWIVDLREDDGGNMWPMLAVLAPLLGPDTLGYFEDADGRRTPWGIWTAPPWWTADRSIPTCATGTGCGAPGRRWRC